MLPRRSMSHGAIKLLPGSIARMLPLEENAYLRPRDNKSKFLFSRRPLYNNSRSPTNEHRHDRFKQTTVGFFAANTWYASFTPVMPVCKRPNRFLVGQMPSRRKGTPSARISENSDFSRFPRYTERVYLGWVCVNFFVLTNSSVPQLAVSVSAINPK